MRHRHNFKHVIKMRNPNFDCEQWPLSAAIFPFSISLSVFSCVVCTPLYSCLEKLETFCSILFHVVDEFLFELFKVFYGHQPNRHFPLQKL